MNAASQLLRNISSNYVKVGVGGLALVLLTPYVVGKLGVTAYAVWIISRTIGYYLGFLDLGLADAQVRQHSVLQAQGATTELGRLHGTVMTVFAAAGAMAVLLSVLVVIAPTASVFDIPPDALDAYRVVVPLLGFGVCISFFELGINGIFEGYQRYDLMNAIDVVVSILGALGVFSVLYFGNGLIGLAVVMLCTSATGAAAKIVVARRVFPSYALPTLMFDRGIWRSIRGFSVWNSLNDLMTEGTANLDKLLIPILLSSALVTPYSLVVMLAAAVLFIAEPITETFFPIAARSHGRNDKVALAGLLARGSKLVNVVTLPTLVVVLCFGTVTLDLWIGEEYTNIPATVLWFTALTFYFSTYLWTAMSILMAVGKVRMVFWASLLEVVLALLLVIALTPRYGLQGLAFAGLITNVAIGMKFILTGACRLTGLKLGELLGRTLLVPLLAVSPALVLGLVLERQVQPQSWIALGLCAGVTGLVGALGIFRVATGRRERFRYFIVARRFLKPIRSIS